MKRLLSRRRLMWLALFVVCWALTPLAFAAADLERGYDSTGGELLLPILPVIILALVIAQRKTID